MQPGPRKLGEGAEVKSVDGHTHAVEEKLPNESIRMNTKSYTQNWAYSKCAHPDRLGDGHPQVLHER